MSWERGSLAGSVGKMPLGLVLPLRFQDGKELPLWGAGHRTGERVTDEREAEPPGERHRQGA